MAEFIHIYSSLHFFYGQYTICLIIIILFLICTFIVLIFILISRLIFLFQQPLRPPYRPHNGVEHEGRVSFQILFFSFSFCFKKHTPAAAAAVIQSRFPLKKVS
jgi:hypothetical protein